MNDLTGVVASLLARARSVGAEEIILNIPAGGEQKEDIEMKIIDFLSQQLQIAVDSLKSAYPNNINGLDAVKDFLDNQEAYAPWLKDFKDIDCYKNRKCLVNEEANDTISRLVQTVNTYWKAPSLEVESSPRSYENVLFNNISYTEFQYNYALNHRNTYREEMAKAIAWKDDNEGDTSRIRQVAELTKASKQEIFDILNPNTNKPFSYKSWVSAYWKVSHQARTGDAGLVFMIFHQEIIERLKELEAPENRVILAYGCQHGAWAAPNWRWEGEIVQVRAYIATITGKQYLSLEMQWERARRLTGFHHLGIIGEKYRALVCA